VNTHFISKHTYNYCCSTFNF